MSRIERFIGVKLTPEPVLTAVQVDQLRTESLVDDILERLKPDAVLPEELKEVEAAPEAMAAALFDLLRERTHREVQPIPEDKPARRTRHVSQPGEEAESPQKGDSWQHKGDTVTLFMNGGQDDRPAAQGHRRIVLQYGGNGEGRRGRYPDFPQAFPD